MQSLDAQIVYFYRAAAGIVSQQVVVWYTGLEYIFLNIASPMHYSISGVFSFDGCKLGKRSRHTANTLHAHIVVVLKTCSMLGVCRFPQKWVKLNFNSAYALLKRSGQRTSNFIKLVE